MSPLSHLDLLEVNGLLDDLVVLGQFTPRGKQHENVADLSPGGVL